MGFFQKKKSGEEVVEAKTWRGRNLHLKGLAADKQPAFCSGRRAISSEQRTRGILAEICTANTQYLWLLPGKDSGPTWSKHISAARRQTATSQSTEAGTVCGAEHQVSNDGPTLLSSSVFISQIS